MRKRNVHIQFWLDEKEAENFNRNVKRSGLSREAYLRPLINGLVPRDAPPPDYYAMTRELFRIGNNLNRQLPQNVGTDVIMERVSRVEKEKV